MRNLVVGTKYLEHHGKMIIENETTRARCVLEFKQNGYWAPSNQVTGIIFSPSNQANTHLEGKWDEQIAQTLEPSLHLRVLWRVTPFPRLANEYYGFTSFGITLNEITEDLAGKLPPTDSRFRPDVRALEVGDIDEAEAQKGRLEEKQRDRRNRGQDRQPRWFKSVGDEWIYTGGYWEARASGWQDVNVEALW
jgi:oxysterol-binding protein-related protein 3/6/7